MKTSEHAQSDRTQRISPAAHITGKRAVNARIDTSRRMVAQRRQLERVFGMPTQRQAREEELQMKDGPGVFQSQGPEEEEALLQGKMIETVQRQGTGEEESLLQGKFAPIQRQGPEAERDLLQGRLATMQRQSPEEEEADVMGSKALQMTRIDQVATNSTARTSASFQRRKRSVSPLFVPLPAVAQRRALNKREREDLADAKERLARLQERYETHKALMTDALRKRGGFGNVLGYFQDLGWDHATQEVTRLDALLSDLADLSRRAAQNHERCREFISNVNFYDKSGGMNRFFNIYKDIEKGLLSKERNDTNQFTELDEVYFRKYQEASKSPLTVYRGDGREVTRDSFDMLPFADMPAGGTPDITFAGVVEHTHTNTLKNGMVSCTTDPNVALHFAIEAHQYGVVWELQLDNYIHVTNLLKTRNFKYRFPGQFEVLYPGAIPESKIVSATLYNKETRVKTRTP